MGPVVADAHGWGEIAWAGGEQIHAAEAGPDDGPFAEPGYTFVSYAGYIPTLILGVIGIIFLIQRLEIERYRAGFYGLFPFMLFGGACASSKTSTSRPTATPANSQSNSPGRAF